MKIDVFEEEESFYPKGKREERKKRKMARVLDRSKYKKTDLKPLEKKSEKDLLRGRVLSVGETIEVMADEKIYICSLKGVFKKEQTKKKNLIVIGDFVHFSPLSCQIEWVEKRKSYLSREELLRKKEQLLAANIDQVFITLSVVSPPLKPSLADRYIIAAKKGNMQPILLINKIDLLDNPDIPKKIRDKEKALYRAFLEAYKDCPILSVSVTTEKGKKELLSFMKDKASLFSGQSGAGKSSLINMVTGLSLKTGPVVKKTLKGAHITSKASLIPLKTGGFCIDSPGIKSFGIWDLKKEEVQNFFPDILRYAKRCKYLDCSHTKEEECAVKKALQKGRLASLRYDSYVTIYLSAEEKKIHR